MLDYSVLHIALGKLQGEGMVPTMQDTICQHPHLQDPGRSIPRPALPGGRGASEILTVVQGLCPGKPQIPPPPPPGLGFGLYWSCTAGVKSAQLPFLEISIVWPHMSLILDWSYTGTYL